MTVSELRQRMSWEEYENWKLYFERKQQIEEQEARKLEREMRLKSLHRRL